MESNLRVTKGVLHLVWVVQHSFSAIEDGGSLKFSSWLSIMSRLTWNNGHMDPRPDLGFVKKIYMSGCSGQNFYTLKVHKLRLSLLKKNSVNALLSEYLISCFARTRSCAALRATDLDWIIGPGYSLGGNILEKNHEKPTWNHE